MRSFRKAADPVKIRSIFRIGVFTLAIVLGARAAFLQSENRARMRLTQEVCALVGNYLETSSVRSAFEGMEQALARSPYRDGCITIIDQGEHYSPDCIDPAKNYQFTACKVEGNAGIRAEISYPVSPFFTPIISAIWLVTWGLLIAFLLGVGSGLTYLTKRVAEELTAKIVQDKKRNKTGLVAQIADWAVNRSGIFQGIRSQIQGFESKIEDYEQRVRSEAVLRAQREIEASRMEGRLEEIRQIRHDLAGPLASLAVVQERMKNDEPLRKVLAGGVRSIQKMLDRFDHAESVSQEPKLTVIEPIAEEVVALLAIRFERAKQVQLSLDYDHAELSPVRATNEGLSRILNNLLENAFDASPIRGTIHLSIRSRAQHYQIVVEDEGPGIPPELIPRLFEKNATHGKVNGTGLGLYHAKQTVQFWGGEIEWESISHGTRFTISLPKLQTGIPFVGLPQTKRLWVVDDDPTVAETLDRTGFEVVNSATTFQQGAALLKKPVPDDVAVLLDYRLDGGKIGPELLAALTTTERIFLCTNDFENEEVLKRARQTGLRVVPKPLCFLAEPSIARVAPGKT